MVFTCKACETRAVKQFSRRSYDRGIVIVTCPGCQNKHLIADNLGWFGDNTNVQQMLEDRGEEVTRMAEYGDLHLDTLLGSAQVSPPTSTFAGHSSLAQSMRMLSQRRSILACV
jgi:mitochondrial protein import protein ZIM17